MEPSHSALIVTIPEAEPVVGAHRERLDTAASWGVPAHVTVLYPFLPPGRLDQRVLGTLSRVAAGVPAFFVRLERLGWFGDRVVWLAPEPAEPFQQLTAAIMGRFPGVRPYEGAFDDVVPHLTIGHDHPAPALTAAGEAIEAHLPIRSRVDTLRLITGRPRPGGSWLTRALFPLG
ncbi:2'-5' RNA ligase family protein [Paractinoplanes globisporus]|jgi:2'-5' RNA ligase|uniref:2'-5' RNA ligase family protein n=1 Tax=Paractinoplanes globisporus TaxID=113565 RepID=A0ABW6WTR5_9ACTN|nr:2'-5' RNA ligase family protein [Actinoplanes globisporus]